MDDKVRGIGTYCVITGKPVPIDSACALHGTECLVRGWFSEVPLRRVSWRERLRWTFRGRY